MDNIFKILNPDSIEKLSISGTLINYIVEESDASSIYITYKPLIPFEFIPAYVNSI